MSESDDVKAEMPVVKRGYAGLLSIWLVPLIAVLIAGWLIVKSVRDEGPEVSISLISAKGMEAGKTRLKYRDVVIGVVERIEIPEDNRGVNVIVSVQRDAEKYMTDTARFWVVAPAIGLQGISGLETLLSGSYLEIDPGKGGDSLRDFVGLDTAPVITSTTAGKEFLLRADRLGNAQRGTPIIYKGIVVGKLLGHKLAEDNASVEMFAFIEAPYDALIHEGTRFWDAGGVNVTLSTAGIEMGADSFQALLSGAVEFETPSVLKDTWIAEEGYEFKLFKNHKSMEDAKFTERLTYILYFDGSVSGLAVGSAVEFKGMKIGTVKEINLEFQQDSGKYFLPVIIDLEPQRVKVTEVSDTVFSVLEEGKIRGKVFQTLVDRGLRARLKSTNFLTGALVVDLDLFPDRPARYLSEGGEFPEIPTLPTELEEITTSLTRLVEKIEKMPIERIANAVLNTAEGLDRIFNSDELKVAIRGYSDLAVSAREMVESIDRRTLPAIDATAKDAQKALQRVDKTLLDASSMFNSADSILAEGSPIKYDLSIMMRELAAASRAVRSFAEYLERNPSSLLGGKK